MNRLTKGLGLFGALAIGGGSTIKGIGNGSAVATLGAITNATTGSATITVAGAAVGDAIVIQPPALTTGLGYVGARVTAADTVTLYFLNASAAPITQGAATFLYTWIDLT